MKINRIQRGILWYAAWLILVPLGAWSLRSSHPFSILLIGPIIYGVICLCFDFRKCAQCGKKVGRITAKIKNCPFCGHELWPAEENCSIGMGQQGPPPLSGDRRAESSEGE